MFEANPKSDNSYINATTDLHRSFALGGLLDATPRDIFSPESGGSMNNSSDMDEMRTHGMMMLKP